MNEWETMNISLLIAVGTPVQKTCSTFFPYTPKDSKVFSNTSHYANWEGSEGPKHTCSPFHSLAAVQRQFPWPDPLDYQAPAHLYNKFDYEGRYLVLWNFHKSLERSRPDTRVVHHLVLHQKDRTEKNHNQLMTGLMVKPYFQPKKSFTCFAHCNRLF